MAKIHGMAFPIEVDTLTGRIKEVTDEDVVRQSIKMILNTNAGERFYHRDFGCGLQEFVFGVLDYTTLKQIEKDVQKSLERWEKRLEYVNVKTSLDKQRANQVIVDIVYKIKNLDTEFNYVHTLALDEEYG